MSSYTCASPVVHTYPTFPSQYPCILTILEPVQRVPYQRSASDTATKSIRAYMRKYLLEITISEYVVHCLGVMGVHVWEYNAKQNYLDSQILKGGFSRIHLLKVVPPPYNVTLQVNPQHGPCGTFKLWHQLNQIYL